MWKLLHCYIDKLLGVKKQLNNLTIKQFNNGFTLIEFLVVLGILLVAVAATLLFLTAILRGTNQANVTAEVKQNGQAVLDSLDREIRNAVGAQSLSNKYLKLTRAGLDPLHIKCFIDAAPPKSFNGWIGTVVSTDDYDSPSDLSYAPITNRDDIIAGVDIQDCNFTVYAATTTSPAVVSVSFVVNQGIAAPSRADFLANAQFQTTISLRKY